MGHIDPVCLVELKDEREPRKSAEDLAVEVLRSVQITDTVGNANDVKIRRASSFSIYLTSYYPRPIDRTSSITTLTNRGERM